MQEAMNIEVSPNDPKLSEAAVTSSSSPTIGHGLPSAWSSFLQAGPSSSVAQSKSSKKGKAKMFILPVHKEKMTRALTIVGQIYGIYFGKEKSIRDLEEIYNRHRKLIKTCYLS
jgi:hypothetical protein